MGNQCCNQNDLAKLHLKEQDFSHSVTHQEQKYVEITYEDKNIEQKLNLSQGNPIGKYNHNEPCFEKALENGAKVISPIKHIESSENNDLSKLDTIENLNQNELKNVLLEPFVLSVHRIESNNHFDHLAQWILTAKSERKKEMKSIYRTYNTNETYRVVLAWDKPTVGRNQLKFNTFSEVFTNE